MLEYIIKQLAQNKTLTRKRLGQVKRVASAKFKKPLATNIELIKVYHKLVKNKTVKSNQNLLNFLKRRRVRTLSGVAVITALTKPYKCPGKCLYCPDEAGMPKSYLKNEPAAARAYLTKFDPVTQVKVRLHALEMTGHPTDKIELIVLGGTWSAYPKNYQYWFIKECFKACNKPNSKINPAIRQNLKKQLKIEQKINETAKHRIVGLTLETRPDCITPKEIKKMRELGCTRVELGIQSIYDDILEKNLRGHNVEQIAKATKLLKDAGFKINYHMMLNLPGSNLKKDEKMFEELFQNPDFQPDFLKIYPCAVLKTAPLYKVWKSGGYHLYSDKQLTNLLIKIKQKIPPYVRIQRIIRDIPKQSIVAGTKISNLRQKIHEIMKKEKINCHCIRCREIKDAYSADTKLKLFRQDYDASDGKEIFLSFEDNKRKNLYALLRLRIPTEITKFLPVLKGAALIRELHTYGQMMPLGKTKNQSASWRTKIKSYAQHKGLGKQLMIEAEKIVKKEFRLNKIVVISGVGVRRYYKKLGYRLKDEYMIKSL